MSVCVFFSINFFFVMLCFYFVNVKVFKFFVTLLYCFKVLRSIFFVMVDDWVGDLKGIKLSGSPLLIVPCSNEELIFMLEKLKSTW